MFNPNIRYIVEGEKEQQEIATYTTGDGREVSIKQTMRYENKTQINRIEWHYFINGEFNSIQNLDMRMFSLKSWIHIWNGMVLVLFINMEDLKKKYLMMIRKNRCLFVNVSLDIDVLLTGKSLYLV